ncbi:site-specific DNA-methyltransferase [Flavobacterium sp.]|uniref:site-specific DNA-methyltransferase n=1 Tax=Flavobacterium sp. TaxID=239 RepID=UPI00262A5649|nr:site-specific DNA-methyltransferase [Flavobacterium sp.]
MEKITALTSADIVADNIKLLKQLFPTIVKEDKIDLNELKALLGESIEEKEEYYRFIWAGKNQARLEANKPTTATLRPNKKDSKDWDTTGNVFIEGDNLEVLKLLQKSYANKIKMIYIDPPYNTGKDFVYKDNYTDNLGNYLNITGQTDEQGKKISTNTESDGRYHSNWLNMMYPRLRLARNLMTDDGVIFISIDDHEVNNLRKCCEEVFGEENFVIQIAWRKSDNQANIGNIARVKEYILCFSKNKTFLNFNKIPLTDKAKKEYSYKDEKGNFRRGILFHKTRGRHYYDVTTKNGKTLNGPWMIKEDEFKELDDKGAILWTSSGEEQPYSKIYLHESTGQIPNDFWDTTFGSNQEASLSLEKIFEQRVFDFPKSTKLLGNICTIGSNKESFILDFFAGSGTTAHAVMQLNAEDGGNRKCISVQLPEPTDEKSEAFKASYVTIAEITKERIRRAGEKIKQDNKDKEGIDKLDIGFKAFKLDSSNIVAWDGNPDNLAEQLDAFANNIKTDRTEEDILFEILLKYGLDLTVAIEEKNIAQQKVYCVGLGTLFICLSNNITPEVSEGIGAWKQELNPTRCRVIFKDTGFASDKDKVNTMQILKRFGVEEVNSI